MKLKVTLIGLGNIGMLYDIHLPEDYVYSHARAFGNSDEFQLVAAVDVNFERRCLFTNKFKVPAYETICEACDNHLSDLYVIAVPTEYHFDIFSELISCTKPKIILCEKPISYDINQAVYMEDYCQHNDIKLFVNYMRISDPGVNIVKQMISENQIGTSFKGQVWYSKGIYNNGSHFINLLEYWFGKVIDSKIINHGRPLFDPEPDFLLNFEKCKVIFMSAEEEHFTYCNLELISRFGRIRYEHEQSKILWNSVTFDEQFTSYRKLNIDAKEIDSGMTCYQKNVAHQLYKDIKQSYSGKICTGKQAITTLKSIDNLLKAN